MADPIKVLLAFPEQLKLNGSRATMARRDPRRARERALWRCGLALLGLLVGPSLHGGVAGSAEGAGPVNIGVLTQSWGPTPQTVGLRAGLLALGYRENEQFVIGTRFTQGDPAALHAAARELIESGVDVIFASDANAARAAQGFTRKIPIVFAAVMNDPVELGLVQSFARPGANITGVSDGDLNLAGKRLEILKEMVPGLKRVLFLFDPSDPYTVAGARAYRDGARQLGLVLVEKPVRTEEEARKTLATLRKGQVDGIVAPPTVSLNLPKVVLDATSQRAIPTMFNSAFFVELGALVSYGADWYESGRQAARLVDKVLKGEDPGRIPVETNSKVELAINMKTAKALKLVIPPSILQRARLIE